jgi:hypothetical protein
MLYSRRKGFRGKDTLKMLRLYVLPMYSELIYCMGTRYYMTFQLLSNVTFLQYQEMYEESISDPEGFWARIAEEFTWKDKVCT